MEAKKVQSGKVSGKSSRTYQVEADQLLPDVSDIDLRKLLRKLSGRKDTAKKANMIRDVIKKREGKSSYRTAKELGMVEQTLRSWLVLIAERGLDGLNDRRTSHRKHALDDRDCECILGWVSMSPVQFGYESDSRDPRLLKRMLLGERGKSVSLRTIRRVMRSLGVSFSKKRSTYRKSATQTVREQFKADIQGDMDEAAKDGFTIMYQDEMGCRPGGVTGRRWHLPEDCEEISDKFSVKISVFGALGKDCLHVKTADAANSNTFIEFLEEMRLRYGKVMFVTDNAAYHDSKRVKQYLESTNGDVRLSFLPKYTPQLNPMEIQWRGIKNKIEGRHCDTSEELSAAVIKLVESGEVPRVKIRNLPIA